VALHHSPDPLAQQYNDAVESAVNDAQNALMVWTTKLTLANAEKNGTGGSTPVHQAKALDFVANTWIDGLNAIIAKLDTGWKTKLHETKADHAGAHPVARYDVKGVSHTADVGGYEQRAVAKFDEKGKPKTEDVVGYRGNAGEQAYRPAVGAKPELDRVDPVISHRSVAPDPKTPGTKP